jgi:hypothetical protein
MPFQWRWWCDDGIVVTMASSTHVKMRWSSVEPLLLVVGGGGGG